MTLPFVDFGVGRRQIRYDWPAITEEQCAALEAYLTAKDYDYRCGSAHVDGFRIPKRTQRRWIEDGTDRGRDDGFEEVEDYWRKPRWSRKELLNVFAAHGVTHVRGYDLPLGHGTNARRYLDTDGRDCLYVGHDDSPDAVVSFGDYFEIDLPYTGEDPQAGRYADPASDKAQLADGETPGDHLKRTLG